MIPYFTREETIILYFKTRNYIGIGCLFIGILYFYLAKQVIQMPDFFLHSNMSIVIVVITCIWIVVSLICKINMVRKVFYMRLNAISVGLWISIIVASSIQPSAITHPTNVIATLEKLVGILFLFGWLVIDILDVIAHKEYNEN